MLIPVLIAIIAACVVGILLMFIRSGKKDDKEKSKIQKKGKNSILKDAEKKLAHDPHNVEALQAAGEIYYTDKNWERAFEIYKTLYDIAAAHLEIDVAKASLRMGISAYNLEKFDDAMASLVLSLKRDPENFEVNFILGNVFYKRNTYDKAFLCLKKARTLNPESLETIELLGLCLFKLSKYRDSLQFLKKALEIHPENKEILYDMAVAMAECSMQEKALKVFMHLRPDPEYGPQAALEAGKMHERVKDYANAVQDYLIALKLQSIPEQTLLQIKYRLANTYIAMNDIPKGLEQLKQIQGIKPNYKDVESLVVRYNELNQNKNLQTYLLSGTSDFVALCRKIIAIYYDDSVVKVEDVQVYSENVEVIAQVESPKWEAKEIFRFYRSQAIIGDIYIREFHGKIRDLKCDAGVSFTMGSYTESAHKFIDGRPIDLIEKDELCKLLKKISMFN